MAIPQARTTLPAFSLFPGHTQPAKTSQLPPVQLYSFACSLPMHCVTEQAHRGGPFPASASRAMLPQKERVVQPASLVVATHWKQASMPCCLLAQLPHIQD